MDRGLRWRRGAGGVLVDRAWQPGSGWSPAWTVPSSRSTTRLGGPAGPGRAGPGPPDRHRGRHHGIGRQDLDQGHGRRRPGSSRLRTTASQKSFNNELGVPLTLANAEPDVEAAVIEMGAGVRATSPGSAEVARPDIGVVTAVAAAHTEAFGDLDAVAAAKAELVRALAGRGDRHPQRRQHAGLGHGGRHRRPGAALLRPRPLAAATGPPTWWRTRWPWTTSCALGSWSAPRGAAPPVRLEARGAHQVGNALAALTVALCCGVPLDAAAAALAGARSVALAHGAPPIAGRGSRSSTTPTTPTRRPWPPPSRPSAPCRPGGGWRSWGRWPSSGPQPVGAPGRRRSGRPAGGRALAVGTDAYGVAPVDGIDEAVAALGRSDQATRCWSRPAGWPAWSGWPPACWPAAPLPAGAGAGLTANRRSGQARRCRSRRAR